MTPHPLSLTARTLYAELRELALAVGATENLGEPPGTVVTKTIRRRRYLYYQYRDLDGRTRQAYLGPDDEATRGLVERLERRGRDRAEDLDRLEELRAAFVAAGGQALEHAPLRVLKAFADAGMLRPGPEGGVLVGTHAFNALGNQLGVRWARRMQTQDIDLAGQTAIDIAVRRPDRAAPDVLTQLDMGFIPAPTLDSRSPSTSFRVRGKHLRVDLLAPLEGKPTNEPLYVPALNAPAQPVRFLEYLIAEVTPTVIVGRKTLLLANVPLPERFALHKLVISEARPATATGKAEKDRVQAAQVLHVLVEEAPDGLRAAKADLVGRGDGRAERLEQGLKKSRALAPEAIDHVARL